MIERIIKRNKHEIIVCFLLFLFFTYKFQHIHDPYLGDELYVYAKGVLYQYDNSPSLLPSEIPVEYSRGHPLFFYFLSSIIFKIFGPSVETAHLFCLSISVAWLGLTYIFSKRLFNSDIALLSFVLLMVQPIVNAQSILLLPEVLLALLTLCSLYFYLKNRIICYLVASSLAVLTKETGLVLPVLVLILTIHPFAKSIDLTHTKRRAWFLSTPVIIFAIFLAIQKTQNGWFFFPLHTHYISFHPVDILNKVFRTTYFFSIAQGRFLISLIVLISVFCFHYYYNPGAEKFKPKKFILISLFVCAIVIFSSLNFYNNRYYLLILAPLFILYGYYINFLFSRIGNYEAIIILAIIIPVFFKYQDKKKYNLDVDLNYRLFIKNQLKAYSYLDSKGLAGRKTYVNYPLYQSSLDPRFGYVREKVNFVDKYSPNVEYVMVSRPDIYKYYMPAEQTMKLIKTFKTEYSVIDLYKVDK